MFSASKLLQIPYESTYFNSSKYSEIFMFIFFRGWYANKNILILMLSLLTDGSKFHLQHLPQE